MSTATDVEPAAALRLLIDSNFFITLEPYGGDLEPGQPVAAEVVRLAAEQGHTVFVHPATRDDLLRAKEPAVRAQRLAELKKFPVLQEGGVPAALTDELGHPASGSNDHRDLRILAALYNNAAAYLITNDGNLRKRAGRVGLADRVLDRGDALELLKQLTPTDLTPPPRVTSVAAYALDGDQHIFTSLHEDYPDFGAWIHKVRADSDNRDCLVITEDDVYAALAIVKKVETYCDYPFPQPVTKLATLKVASDFVGSKYGELLLKSVFMAANARGAASIYVEIYPKHEVLIDLLGRFGFTDSGHRNERDELVLVKHLQPPPDTPPLSALDHHIRYGPPAVLGTGNVFAVPIWPTWHRQLFPDAPEHAEAAAEQLTLLEPPDLSTHPWGNALRKAYLCNSKNQQIAPGDTLLFYRSHDAKAVVAVGVVEDTLRSGDPAAILGFVAGRTVYRPDEIEEMCARVGGTLAILFRQDRSLDPPWTHGELLANEVLRAAPQSITQIRGGGREWVHERLNE